MEMEFERQGHMPHAVEHEFSVQPKQAYIHDPFADLPPACMCVPTDATHDDSTGGTDPVSACSSKSFILWAMLYISFPF
jgi:hypothetical protein